MITTNQVKEAIKSGKIDFSEINIGIDHIEHTFHSLIEDDDYITQMLVQATNATKTEAEAIEFIIKDYISSYILGYVMQKLNDELKFTVGV